MCVYYVFERGMDRGVEGGRGRESTRNESGLERKRDEYDITTRDSIPLSVYMQGGRELRQQENFFCVWCLCWYVWV